MSEIVSRPYSKTGEDTWDRIFGKKGICQSLATLRWYNEHDFWKGICVRCHAKELKILSHSTIECPQCKKYWDAYMKKFLTIDEYKELMERHVEVLR